MSACRASCRARPAKLGLQSSACRARPEAPSGQRNYDLPGRDPRLIRLVNPNAIDTDFVVRLPGTSEGDHVTLPNNRIVIIPNPHTVEVGSVSAGFIKEPDRCRIIRRTFNDGAMSVRNFPILIEKILAGATTRSRCHPAKMAVSWPPNADGLDMPDLQMNVEGRERETRHGQPALS